MVPVAPLDIIVDVGGVYSPENHRYDHHQRGFSEVFGHGGYNTIKFATDISDAKLSLSTWDYQNPIQVSRYYGFRETIGIDRSR